MSFKIPWIPRGSIEFVCSPAAQSKFDRLGFPKNYYNQEALLEALIELWGDSLFNPDRLRAFFQNMNVDGRYQFEPGRVVRRGGLAEIVAATLLLIAEFDPESGRRWRAARPRFTDLTSDHLNFDSASIAFCRILPNTIIT